MAQPPTTRPPSSVAATPKPALPARRGRRDLAPASADAADAAAPILLEFESPSAALLARPVPARSRYVVWILSSMFAAALTVSATMPMDRVVTAEGKVVSAIPNLVVQPLETSIVRSIDVKQGQTVHKGDILARLDPTFASSDAVNLESQVIRLRNEVNRLQAELDGRNYVSDGSQAGLLQDMIFAQRHAELSFKMEAYRQQIESLQAKVTQAQSDVKGYTDRLAVAKTVEDKRHELERLQVGSALNTLAATDNRVEMTRGLDTARSNLAGALQDLAAKKSERDGFLQQFRADTSQQLHDESLKLDQAQGDAQKAALRQKLVELRAPEDAVVLTVAPVSVGSVMQSGDQFITLVPVDAPLEIQALVEGRDAGFVRVGDPVTIKFETFPYYTHGTASGVVRVIGQDSSKNPIDENTIAGMQAKMALQTRSEMAVGLLFYDTRISIDEMKLHDLPPGFRLTPGMPVTADVKVGERTFIQYMLSRVIPATTEGMREP